MATFLLVVVQTVVENFAVVLIQLDDLGKNGVNHDLRVGGDCGRSKHAGWVVESEGEKWKVVLGIKKFFPGNDR